MRTIIAGSRALAAKPSEVVAAIESCPWLGRITVVLSGDAPGVDRIGAAWARQRGLPVETYPALWRVHGRAAGPERNVRMADAAEALVLVWDGRSRGSAHMLRTARAHALRIHARVLRAL